MATILKKDMTRETYEALLNQAPGVRKRRHSSKPGLDPSKYLGKVKFAEDPVDYQKKLRDEWN